MERKEPPREEHEWEEAPTEGYESEEGDVGAESEMWMEGRVEEGTVVGGSVVLSVESGCGASGVWMGERWTEAPRGTGGTERTGGNGTEGGTTGSTKMDGHLGYLHSCSVASWTCSSGPVSTSSVDAFDETLCEDGRRVGVGRTWP